MPKIESVLSAVMQQQTTNNEMTLRLAAELEKIQSTLQQLEVKSQAQELTLQGGKAASQASSVTSESEDSSSSDEDDYQGSDADFPSWLRAKMKKRESQQSEGNVKVRGVSTSPVPTRDQGTQTPQPTESLENKLDAYAKQELAKWRSAARQYETQTGYYKLRAETAEKKLKALGK